MDCRDNIYKKTGGFIKGICHPKGEIDALLNAGLEWVRSDIPFPVKPDGTPTESYLYYKKECEAFAAKGIHTIAITNYGRTFIEHGIDVRTPEGLKKAEEICKFAAADLAGSVVIWQITNEVNLAHMREPLTNDEGRDFIIACIKGVRAGNPNAVVGHNSYGDEWLEECREIERQTGGCDYIGYDLYDCTWSAGPYTNYAEKIEKIYQTMGLPVILMEFGFSSRGTSMSYEKGDFDRWLQARGIPSVQAALDDLDGFTKILTKPDLISKAKVTDRRDPYKFFLPFFQHESESWIVDSEFEHDEHGQYEFYAHLLPDLLNHPHLAGAVLYCMKDSTNCYFCGSPTCCCEIAWGILNLDGTPKEAYYAVQKHFKKN